MFVFLIQAASAEALAQAMAAFEFRGPVHDRIIHQLRGRGNLQVHRENRGQYLCEVSPADKAVLQLWAVDPQHKPSSWQADLIAALEDGARF